MKDGKKIEEIIKDVKGGQKRPLTIEDISFKFLEW